MVKFAEAQEIISDVLQGGVSGPVTIVLFQIRGQDGEEPSMLLVGSQRTAIFVPEIEVFRNVVVKSSPVCAPFKSADAILHAIVHGLIIAAEVHKESPPQFEPIELLHMLSL